MNVRQPKFCVAAFGSDLHYSEEITDIFSPFLESNAFTSAHVFESI